VIVTESRDVQDEKADGEMVFTPLGIVISFIEEHWSNAFAPIEISDSGRTTLSRELHPQKARSGIKRIPSGTTTSFSETQLRNISLPEYSVVVNPAGRIILSRDPQKLKAESPILLTPSGRTSSVSEPQ
jgi:hypothetical protein